MQLRSAETPHAHQGKNEKRAYLARVLFEAIPRRQVLQEVIGGGRKTKQPTKTPISEASVLEKLNDLWETVTPPPFPGEFYGKTRGIKGVYLCLKRKGFDFQCDGLNAHIEESLDDKEFGYHGSPAYNWASIISQDIVVPGRMLDGTLENGHLYGKGVYVSTFFKEANPYTIGTGGETGSIRIVAVVKAQGSEFEIPPRHCTDSYRKGIVKRTHTGGRGLPMVLIVLLV